MSASYGCPQDPLSVESFYREHYDQGVVVRLLHSPSIFLVERHVLVYSSLLKRRYHVNAVHLPLTCFLKGSEWPACEWPNCDRLYFPDHSLRTLGHVILVFRWELALVFIIVSEPAGFSLLHIHLQFSFPYQFLYLLLQVPAIFCVVAMILVEPVVLLLVSDVRGWM